MYAHVLAKKNALTPMVLILDGNSDYVAQVWKKIGLIWENLIIDCSWSNKMS